MKSKEDNIKLLCARKARAWTPRHQIRPGSGSNRSGFCFHTFGAAPEEIAHCPVEAEALAEEEDHGHGNGRNSNDNTNSVNEYCSFKSVAKIIVSVDPLFSEDSSCFQKSQYHVSGMANVPPASLIDDFPEQIVEKSH
uniref:Uncharacterized protein n=1 Tax=Solanum lycopersicum TaxID=4081 RepID=A0A3Q7H360_SOLLC